MTQVELGEGLRIRAAATGELAHHWPEAQGLLPPGFGREVDRYCVLELERALEAGAEPPDAPAELADAVSALRLATGAPVAAGPVLFERLDWRPFGIRPALPIAATQPPGRADAARLVPRRARRASCSRGSRSRTPTLRSPRRSTAGSSRSSRTSRSGPSSCAPPLAALLGETWELRAAVLLGAVSDERRAIHAALRALARRRAGVGAGRDVGTARARRRRCGTATGSTLVRSLDDALLGLRAAPRLAQTA